MEPEISEVEMMPSPQEKLLLHICCAPDATSVFERLRQEYAVTGFFHNPNIHPASEFQKRAAAARQVAAAMGFSLILAEYQPDAWLQSMRGLEKEPERGLRCEACYAFNLRATAAKAKELGFKGFTSTLAVSPHKPVEKIFAAGREAGRAFQVDFLERDFKKQDGFKRSLELSKGLGIYRQNYCGCRFSLRVSEHA